MSRNKKRLGMVPRDVEVDGKKVAMYRVQSAHPDIPFYRLTEAPRPVVAGRPQRQNGRV